MRWLGVLVAALTAPAVAQGSTATMQLSFELGDHGGPDYHLAHVQIVAAPGEANAIAVRFEDDVVIVDDSAGVAPGANCVTGALDEVRCPAPPGSVATVKVDSGDGDDDVSLGPGILGWLELGPGDDRGTAQASAWLHGGPGDDVLAGGSGDDALVGGPGSDVMTGGDGSDQVSYLSRRAPITAIVGGLGGETGEGDAIGADIEQISGGSGPDVIRGSEGDEVLYGGSGDDAIDGRGGDDFVVPGPGRDRFVSSGGVDRLYLRDGERDSAACGHTGSVTADNGDLVLHCARVERAGAGHVTLAASPSSVSDRSLRVRLGCSSDLRRGCAGSLAVRTGGRLAGRRPFVLRAGEDRVLAIALRRFALRRLDRVGHLRVQLRADTRDARGRPVALRDRAVARRR